jgi:hypothetical protein
MRIRINAEGFLPSSSQEKDFFRLLLRIAPKEPLTAASPPTENAARASEVDGKGGADED